MNLKIYGGSETATANAIAFNVSADRTYTVELFKEAGFKANIIRITSYKFNIYYMNNSGEKVNVGPAHDMALCVKNAMRDFIRYRTLHRTKTWNGTVASITDVARARLNEFLANGSTTVISDKTIAQEEAEIDNVLAFTAALEAAEDIARQHAINAALDARDEELFMTLTGGA